AACTAVISSCVWPSGRAWPPAPRCCGCREESTMAERVNARILGLGRHLPDRVVTNDDLAARMETSDEWIQQRTGIHERRHIGADAGPADLAAPAAREALKNAGVRAEDL